MFLFLETVVSIETTKGKCVPEKTRIVAYSMQWQIFMNMRNQYCLPQSKYRVLLGQYHLVLGLNTTSGTLRVALLLYCCIPNNGIQ